MVELPQGPWKAYPRGQSEPPLIVDLCDAGADPLAKVYLNNFRRRRRTYKRLALLAALLRAGDMYRLLKHFVEGSFNGDHHREAQHIVQEIERAGTVNS